VIRQVHIDVVTIKSIIH